MAKLDILNPEIINKQDESESDLLSPEVINNPDLEPASDHNSEDLSSD